MIVQICNRVVSGTQAETSRSVIALSGKPVNLESLQGLLVCVSWKSPRHSFLPGTSPLSASSGGRGCAAPPQFCTAITLLRAEGNSLACSQNLWRAICKWHKQLLYSVFLPHAGVEHHCHKTRSAHWHRLSRPLLARDSAAIGVLGPGAPGSYFLTNEVVPGSPGFILNPSTHSVLCCFLHGTSVSIISKGNFIQIIEISGKAVWQTSGKEAALFIPVYFCSVPALLL